jgi:hypothetical protein
VHAINDMHIPARKSHSLQNTCGRVECPYLPEAPEIIFPNDSFALPIYFGRALFFDGSVGGKD